MKEKILAFITGVILIMAGIAGCQRSTEQTSLTDEELIDLLYRSEPLEIEKITEGE